MGSYNLEQGLPVVSGSVLPSAVYARQQQQTYKASSRKAISFYECMFFSFYEWFNMVTSSKINLVL